MSFSIDTVSLIQGDRYCSKTPLFLVHAVSGLALPYFALGALSKTGLFDDCDRCVYGITSPSYASDCARPSTLARLAREYVDLVRETQPEGPYLLGGWSMGGMIALKMAEILESQGDEVLQVIMIDSFNPEHSSPFLSHAEHDEATSSMYDAMACRMSSSSDSDSSDEETTEDDEIEQLLVRVRQHIHYGLRLISQVKRGYLKARISAPVVLIKCKLPAHGNENRKTLRKAFQDKLLGWKPESFRKIDVLSFEAEHDSAFDATHAPELTRIFRKILANID